MKEKIKKLIIEVYDLPYSNTAKKLIREALSTIYEFIEQNHFLNRRKYHSEIESIEKERQQLSSFLESREDKIRQRRIQKNIANLCRTILDENKKVFIVHGRNIAMRDKVCALLGRLKIDYVVLESEYNNGSTVIEKFTKIAKDCEYAIILFSADDLGKLSDTDSQLKYRARQNVIFELGYFLSHVGRENIVILHEHGKEIEKPSDFDGIVYEAFDESGAWKIKLIREMKTANIYIAPELANRI